LLRNAKKKWAEKRARRKEHELERSIDEAMTRTPIIERLPEVTSSKPISDIEDDDWFAPIATVTPKA
jgi:hypothetical protein